MKENIIWSYSHFYYEQVKDIAGEIERHIERLTSRKGTKSLHKYDGHDHDLKVVCCGKIEGCEPLKTGALKAENEHRR